MLSCAVQVTLARLMAEARPSAVLDLVRRMSPPQDAGLHGGNAKPPLHSPLAKMVGQLKAELSPRQLVILTRHWHRYLERVSQERLRHFALAQVRCVCPRTASCNVLLLRPCSWILLRPCSWMWACQVNPHRNIAKCIALQNVHSAAWVKGGAFLMMPDKCAAASVIVLAALASPTTDLAAPLPILRTLLLHPTHLPALCLPTCLPACLPCPRTRSCSTTAWHPLAPAA